MSEIKTGIILTGFDEIKLEESYFLWNIRLRFGIDRNYSMHQINEFKKGRMLKAMLADDLLQRFYELRDQVNKNILELKSYETKKD